MWIREEVLENPEQPKKEKAKVQRTAPPPKKEEEPEPPAFSKKEKAKAQRSAAPPAFTRLERLMQDVQREATSNRVRLSLNRASLDPGIRNKSDPEPARTQLLANDLNRDAPAPALVPPPRAAPAPASLQVMGSGDAWPAPAPAPARLAFQQEFGGANSQAQALPQRPKAEEEEAAADDQFAWVGHTFGWVGNTWNDTVKPVVSMIGGTPNPSSVDSADVRRVDPNRIVH
jgi:hypothetical protein